MASFTQKSIRVIEAIVEIQFPAADLILRFAVAVSGENN